MATSTLHRMWDERVLWGWLGWRIRKLICQLTDHKVESHYEEAGGCSYLIEQWCERCWVTVWHYQDARR